MSFLDKIILDIKQTMINREYNKNGLTDDVLEKQIAVNKKRHELNIPDSSKKINGDFVQ